MRFSRGWFAGFGSWSRSAEGCLSVALFVLAFGVYALTLCRGVMPGASAAAMAQTLGLLPGVTVSHPVWLTFSRAVAALPGSHVPLILNLATAFCGALAVAMLFRISHRTLVEIIRPEPSIRLVPVSDGADGEGADDEAGAESDCESREHVGALLAGTVCALAFAFSAPFWIASTALHVQPLGILLFLMALDLLLRYVFTGRLAICLCAVFLAGLLVVESPVFLLLTPVLAFLLVGACLKYEHLSESFLLALAAVGMAGVGGGLALVWLHADPAQRAAAGGASGAVTAFVHAYRGGFAGLVPSVDGLFSVALPLLGLLLAGVGLRRATFCRDEVSLWKWQLMNALCTAFAVAQMLNLPRTVWGMAREGTHLPILPALVVAGTVGLLFLYWFQTATVMTYNADGEFGDPPAWRRIVGLSACGLLTIILLRSVGINLRDADGSRALFADAVAKEMLEGAAGAQCVVADGTLDLNLLVRSHLSGRPVAVMPSVSQASSAAESREASASQRIVLRRPGERGGADVEADLVHWLKDNPGKEALIAVVGTPSLWRQAGFEAVPSGLLYAGLRNVDGPGLAARFATNRAAWERLAPLLKDDPTLLPALRRAQSEARTHVSRLANDMGTALDQAARGEEAEAAYVLALALDENNLSAALNRISLHVRLHRVADAGPVTALSERPALCVDPSHLGDALDRVAGRYGTILTQPADRFLPTLLKGHPGEMPLPPGLLRFYGAWLAARPACMQPAVDGKPERIAASSGRGGEEKGVPPELKRAYAARAEGRDDDAERIARRVVANHPASQCAMAFLSELLLKRGAKEEVSSSLLPAMRAVAGGIESPFVLAVQGGVCMRMNPPRLLEARASFTHALELNRTMTLAQEWLLEVDRALGNSEASEADARTVLESAPAHPVAHAILGQVMARQMRLSEAEAHFRASLAARPGAECYSALSELLRRRGAAEEAEGQARLALRLEPCDARAWQALGLALLDRNELDAASEALTCALKVGDSTPEAYLPLITLRMKQNLRSEAERLLRQAEKRLGQSPAASARAALSELRQNLRVSGESAARGGATAGDKASGSLAQVTERK